MTSSSSRTIVAFKRSSDNRGRGICLAEILPSALPFAAPFFDGVVSAGREPSEGRGPAARHPSPRFPEQPERPGVVRWQLQDY